MADKHRRQQDKRDALAELRHLLDAYRAGCQLTVTRLVSLEPPPDPDLLERPELELLADLLSRAASAVATVAGQPVGVLERERRRRVLASDSPDLEPLRELASRMKERPDA